MEGKGKSRKAKYPLFRKGLYQTKRLMATVLGISMVTANIGSTTVWAAVPETKTKNTNFVFDQTELGNALIDAANGNSVTKDFSFVGEAAEDYEGLFELEDEKLYELKGLEQNKGDLTVKVYARLSADGFVMDEEDESEDEDDEYMITGDEQIIFLLLNSSAKQTGTIEVAGNTSQKIEILSAKELKKQMKIEEEVPAPDKADAANGSEEKEDTDTTDTPETTAPDGGTTDTPETTTPDGETEDTTETTTPDGETKDTTGSTTPDGETKDTTDTTTSDGATTDAKDTTTSDGETGTEGTKSENTGSASENAGNTSEKADSTSEKANSASENAGEQTEAKASRSAHFQMFLMAPAEETSESEAPTEEVSSEDKVEVVNEEKNTDKAEASDEVEKAENVDKADDADTADDAETTKNTKTEAEPEETEEKVTSEEAEETVEETTASLSGTVYESVLLKDRAAAAFTSTVAQLLGNEAALLALGEEHVINVKGEVEWPDIQTQIDTILTTDPTASVKILGEGDDAVIKMSGVTGEVGLYNFKAIELESDTTFDNVTFLLPGTESSNKQPDIVMFANGHKLVMESDVSVTYDGNHSKRMYIFGGGNKKSVDQTHLQIDGGDWQYIYGGSYQENVGGETYVHVSGDAAVKYLYGGCYGGVSEGNIYVEYGCCREYYSKIPGSSAGKTFVRGGGHDIAGQAPVADVTGNRLEIKILPGAVLSEVYGATNSMLHCDDIYVTVEKGVRVLNSVSGGTSTSNGDILSKPANGFAIKGKQYTANSDIHVEFNGDGRKDSDHLYSASVYGGGIFGNVNGNIDVTVNGDVQYVYGGSSNGDVTGDINIEINGGVHAGGHNADMVMGNVSTWYGGTVTSGCTQGNVTGNIVTTITKNGTIHAAIGGCEYGVVTGNTRINVYGRVIRKNYESAARYLNAAGCIFGGGYSNNYGAESDVKGTASIYVYEGSDIQDDVYGGGRSSNVSGGSKIVICGTLKGCVYGGCCVGDLSGGTQIEVPGIVGGIVCGGGYYGDVIEGGTYVNVQGAVKGDVYGGGRNADVKAGGTQIEVPGTVEGNIYGGGKLGNMAGDSTILLKGKAKNIYGTGNGWTTEIMTDGDGNEQEVNKIAPTISDGNVRIQLQDSAVVDDTIYGYEIVNIEGTPTKLLTGRADVNFINSDNGGVFKRVENADLVRATEKSNVMIDNDYKNNEQLVNVSDLVIDGSAALKLGADAHILGNYQGDAGKSATLIIPAGKCLTADGTVTDLTNISIYDLNGIVPEKAQIYVISGAGSTKENGDFSWIDERNNVHMEWNKLSAGGKEKEGKKTMWWLVNGPSSSTPSDTPSGGGGGHSHGGGGHSHGGGSRSHSVKTNTAQPDIPMQVLPKVDTEPVEPEIPMQALPKTGDAAPISSYMAMLTIGLMAAAYVMMADRKKEKE